MTSIVISRQKALENKGNEIVNKTRGGVRGRRNETKRKNVTVGEDKWIDFFLFFALDSHSFSVCDSFEQL